MRSSRSQPRTARRSRRPPSGLPRAGVDLLLLVGPESSTARAYDALLAAARSGRLPRASLERSARRIDELAATYAG